MNNTVQHTQHALKTNTTVTKKFKITKTYSFHLMLLPAVILTIIFQYLPMGGIILSFKEFKPWMGILESPWVGWFHFETMFERADSKQVIWNTLLISFSKIVLIIIVPVIFALLLNEVRIMIFKRTIQTLVYLPHFLSWVILGAILVDILSPERGMINMVLVNWLGMKPIFFLGHGDWFRATAIITHTWKEFGFGTIIYLAALAGVNPSLYEAAEVDGANRWKQTMYITIPSLVPIIIVCVTLELSNILNAGFDQIFNLYNPMVYDKGDVIDTFVYRIGILNQQMSFATAIGLFKSAISCILIVSAYRISYVYANYRIF